jgi:hypothetical protein
MADELQSASEQADLIAYGLPSRVGTGSGMPAFARSSSRLVLILPHGATLQPRFAVVVDRGESSRRALAQAVQLASEEKQKVTVLLAPCDDVQAQELGELATTLLGENSIEVERLYRVDAPATSGLLAVLKAVPIGTLILPADLDWLTREALEVLLDAAECPVLLVS